MERKPTVVKAQIPCIFYQDVIPPKLVDLMVEEVEKINEKKVAHRARACPNTAVLI